MWAECNKFCHSLIVDLDWTWRNSASIENSKSPGRRAEQLTTALHQQRETESKKSHLCEECLINHQLSEGVALARKELDVPSARNSKDTRRKAEARANTGNMNVNVYELEG